MKLPKLYQRKRRGRAFGSWYVEIKGERINLRTQDAQRATERRREALKGKRVWKDDAEGAAESILAAFESADGAKTPAVVEGQPAQVAPSPGPAEPAPAAPPLATADGIRPDGYAPPSAAGWADDANAAASAADAASKPPPPAPEVSDDQLANLGVDGQVWIAEWRAKAKIYKGFVAPPLPDEGRAELAKPWKTLIAYANIGAILPPWVTGLVIPIVSIVTATAGLVAFFAEAAEQQRVAAGAPRQTQPPAPAGNADATAEVA